MGTPMGVAEVWRGFAYCARGPRAAWAGSGASLPASQIARGGPAAGCASRIRLIRDRYARRAAPRQ